MPSIVDDRQAAVDAQQRAVSALALFSVFFFWGGGGDKGMFASNPQIPPTKRLGFLLSKLNDMLCFDYLYVVVQVYNLTQPKNTGVKHN